MMFIIGALALWIAPSRQTSSAQDGVRPPRAPSFAGYTDAPTARRPSAAIPRRLCDLEVRVVEGQKIKRDDILAVMSNYPKSVAIRSTEAELAKASSAQGDGLGLPRRRDRRAGSRREVVGRGSKLKVLRNAAIGKPPT